MADFSKCIPFTLKYEGGYSDVKEDRGGATKYGISLAFLQNEKFSELLDVNGDGKINSADIRDLTLDQAILIYKQYFWDVFDLDSIESDKKAFLLFDAAVNHGIGGATALVQRTLNSIGFDIAVDKRWGPKTRSAFENAPEDEFIKMFQEKRTALYKAIIANNPSQKIFERGWMNRIKWTTQDLEKL